MIILNQDNIWLRVRYISSQDTSSETHGQTRIRLQSIYIHVRMLDWPWVSDEVKAIYNL